MSTEKTGYFIWIFLFVVGLILLSPSIVTWDEPENYFAGRVYLNVYRSLSLAPLSDQTSLEIPPPVAYRAETHWERYPPFALSVSSLVSYLVSDRLGLVPPIVAHHIAVVGFAAFAAVNVYWIARLLGGSVLVSVVSAIVLLFSPVMIGHMQANPKDIPFTALFTYALYAGVVAIRRRSWGAAAIAGIAWGCALATKLSAVVVPVILILYALGNIRTVGRGVSKIMLFGMVVLYGVCAVVIVIFAWPWIAQDPVRNIGSIIQYIGEVGRGLPVLFDGVTYKAGVNVPWWYAPMMVVLQTPPIILLLAGAGVVLSKKRLLPLVWLLVVFVRYVDPRIIIYNGSRHVMEVFPAVALLAGMGFEELIHRLPRSLRYPRILIAGVIVMVLLLPILSLHPYEAMYYNQLAGGVAAASNRYDFDYWGFSVGALVDRAGDIEPDATKIVYIEWIGFPKDHFPATHLTFTQEGSAGADYVIIPHSLNYFGGAIDYWKQHGRLVYTVSRGDAIMGYLFATHK